ncbi:MAG TPA: hypothetical protein VJR90_01050 [Gammaproteobacteria bacterium]|nr:hypothetical protein [Gammaproteobacteria bacterium]
MPTANTAKTLSPAPLGLTAPGASAAANEPLVEIEVVDDNGEPVDDQAGVLAAAEAPLAFGDNLLGLVDDQALAILSGDIDTWVDEDKRSRDDWEQTYREGLKLLGLKYEERTEPWEGACGVTHPMITEAVVRFQSETIMETFPAAGPVNTKIIGEETPPKKEAAARVRAEMNYQLTEKMIEFRSEHEKMLWNLAPVGCAFKKVYNDPSLGRQVSTFVPAEDVVMPYSASNIYSSERVTHVMRKSEQELQRLQAVGFYDTDAVLGTPGREIDEIKEAKDEATGFSDINDDSYTVYETQVSLILEGLEDSDKPRPYVVTKIKGGAMLSIRRNWNEEDALSLRRHHFVQYDYVPGFGPYGYGLFHLIGGYAKASTSILRQLVDAGTLSNLPGGLKTKGLRIKGDDTPISPGEWRDVDVMSGTLRDNLMPLPYKEPSLVLAGLLDKIVEDGRRIPGTADMKISDMSAQAPVGTTLALLERQLKVMSAVQARTHNSLKQELKLLKEAIRDSGDDDYTYETTLNQPGTKQADFALVDVIPVSDPSAATMSQRVVQYQAAIQLSGQAPQVYNLAELHRGMLEVLGIKNAAKLVPAPQEAVPADPVTENMNVLMAKPVKAFMPQDHAAHLAVHQAMLQDPVVMQSLGQNPQAPMLMQAMQAHIAEHTAYQYRASVQQALGQPLPDPAAPMDEQQAQQLAQALAQAAQQVMQANQQQAQAQQAQQQAQDPMLQLQIRALDQRDKELGIKEKELQVKAADLADKQDLAEKKLMVDASDKSDKLDLNREKLIQQGELGEQQVRVKALQVGMMGRAQDQELLAQDRANAQADVDRLQAEHESNQMGLSRTPPTEPKPVPAAPAAPPKEYRPPEQAQAAPPPAEPTPGAPA